MTDKKNENDKGPVSRPGDGPRRPHATLDLKANEVGSNEADAGARASTASEDADRSGARPEQGGGEDNGGRTSFARRLAAASRWSRGVAINRRSFSHVVAGVAGGALTLAISALLGLFGPTGIAPSADVGKRLTELEQTVRQRASAQSTDVSRITQAETRLKELEQQSRVLSTLSDAQTKLAASVKALEARGGASDYTSRLNKVETTVAALSANDRSGQAEALAEKLTTLEKQVGEALEVAKSGSDRMDRGFESLQAELKGLVKRFEALKAETEQRFRTAASAADLSSIAAKVATFEREFQALQQGEDQRASNASRVLLTLEIANLKRAMDRGEPYATELAAIRKLAGKTLNLAPLERFSAEGAPTLPVLIRDFRQVADNALDAESDAPNASVIDRLMSGARSIVRVRKSGHSAEDMSAEATIGRMESALKNDRLAEVLEQAKKLPPKAALATEEWLKKVEARYAVDRALAQVELALKSSLAAAPAPAAEPKR